MNILFIGGLYSQDQISKYKANSKGSLQFAAQNLQESIIEGLIQNNVSVTVLSKPILSTYPSGYKEMTVKETPYLLRGCILGKSFGYINLPFINHPSKKKYLSEIEEWYNKGIGDKEVWVYSLNKHFMKMAIAAKERHPDIRLLLIVPDLPRFMGRNMYYEMIGQYERDSKIIYDNIHKFDRFVLLSKYMAEDLGVENKPYTVMEGIFTPDSDQQDVEKTSEKVILYTGNLDARYGIPELLDAFSLIKDSNYRLWLRGNGGCETLVNEVVKRDPRVVLIPAMSKSELLQLQKRATLLVNPVQPTQEFTKFFFPSKTMDYLASGTPTLMFNLACLPTEYKEHLFFFDGTTPTDMANSIMQICTMPEGELQCKGERAQKFIMSGKLAKNQVKKILQHV